MEVDISAKCGRCGNSLESDEEQDYDSDVVIIVKPCEDCIEQEIFSLVEDTDKKIAWTCEECQTINSMIRENCRKCKNYHWEED